MRQQLGVIRVIVLAASACLSGRAADQGCLDPGAQQALLSELQHRAAEEMLHAPQHLCRESIERRWYRAPESALQPRGCGQATDDDSYSLLKYDKVHLDVAVRGESEIFSWPGAGNFDTSRIDKIVLRGPILSGTFVGFLNDLFVKRRGLITCFSTKRTSDGRVAITFEFVVPQKSSSFIFRTDAGESVLGYSGSFSVFRDTVALSELHISVGELPSASPFCNLRLDVEYPNGESGFGELIPKSVQLSLHTRFGERETSEFLYTGCRTFVAASTLSFRNAPPPIDAHNEASDIASPKMQTGMKLWIRTTSAINTATAAAGDVISGRVVRTESALTGSHRFSQGRLVIGHVLSAEHYAHSGAIRLSVLFEADRTPSTEPLPLSLTRVRAANLSGSATYTMFPIDSNRNALVVITTKPIVFRIPITEWQVLSADRR